MPRKAKDRPPRRQRSGHILDYLSLRWRMFGYFLGFAVLLLVLLWLFQIVYLDAFYQRVKTSQIEGAAGMIERNIDNPELEGLVQRLAQNNELCVTIINPAAEYTYTADVLPNCLIHHISSFEVLEYFLKTSQEGGTYAVTVSRSQFRNSQFNPNLYFGPGIPADDRGLSDSMIYCRLFANEAGKDVFLILNSNISPVDATSSTLRVQLYYITLIIIGMALVLSFLFSRRLAAPIARINKSAKNLAKSNFSASFDGKGYRETIELADTLNYVTNELSRAERLQQELIANISHDLRTPLTMIGGYAEAMRDLPGENTPENAQVIIDEVRRLSSLVNDVLDLSKLQAGVNALELHVYNLTKSLVEIVANYSRLTAPDGYTVSFEHDGNETWVKADESKIDQVVYNFLSNALTYTGEDKTVIVRQTLQKQFVRVEVIDSGGGIPKEQLANIWQRYYRSEENHVRASQGSGLGLSIVRGILEQHGVRYGVKSELNRGSTFWFELPVHKVCDKDKDAKDGPTGEPPQ